MRGAISVAASAPAQTDTSQAQTDTTVTVSFADGAVHDLGGVDGELSYQLESNGLVIARAGPTTQPTVKLSGITAGQTYDVRVTRQPAAPPGGRGHPAAGAGRAGLRASGRSRCHRDVHQHQRDRRHADRHARSRRCRHSWRDVRPHRQQLLALRQRAAGAGRRQLPERRQQHHARPCGVLPRPEPIHLPRQLHSVDPARTEQRHRDQPTAVRRGPSAQTAGASVDISPPQVTTSQNDFAASFVESTRTSPQIAVSYHGSDDLGFATNWTFTANNGTRNCGSTRARPTAIIDVDPGCAGSTANWTVHITLQLLPEPSGLHRGCVRYRAGTNGSQQDQLRRRVGRHRAECRRCRCSTAAATTRPR